MNKHIILYPIVIIISLAIGFFAGEEYKAYQIRSAFQQAFSGNVTTTQNPTSGIQPTITPYVQPTSTLEGELNSGSNLIVKKVGDIVTLATMDLKIISSEEQQSISGNYGSPEVANEGTKFVIVQLTVTNTTKSQYDFPDNFLLKDSQKREYSPYSSIGKIDKYISMRTLKPSIPETGFSVYQVPKDSVSYSLFIGKAGSKDIFQIILK